MQVIQPQKFKAEVLKVSRASPTVCLLDLSTKNAQNFDFVPGQFVMVHMEVDGKKINKSYSIVSPHNGKNKIELCIKEVPLGHVSRRLCTLQKGDELEISGPFGLFTLKMPLQRDIVFAATGTGISSVKSMIESIFEKGTDKEIWLLFGVRNQNEILYFDDFEFLAKRYPNFHFVPILSQSSPEWQREKGYVQDHLLKFIKEPNNFDIYICGVIKSVDDIKMAAEKMGFQKEQIHFEKYV